MPEREKCPLCGDDGYVEQWTSGGHLLADECPRLNDPGHAPFNATGILGPFDGEVAQGQEVDRG